MAYVTNIKTVITYDLDNTTKTFVIPFEYLSRAFVVVTLIGTDRKVLDNITDYTFMTSTQITTNVAWGDLTGYDQIEIRRQTSASERIVDFQNGSVLRADDLNVSQIQSLHLAEEARDLVSDTIGTDNDGNLDARGRKLINLGDGTEDGDAVNLRQQKAWAGSALNQADRAKTEADRAQAQANISTNQATISTNQATIATNQATISVNAAAAAKTSETNAKTSETNAAASEASALASRNTATAAASTATTEADRAKTEADRAQSANPDNQLKKANNLSDVSSVATSRTNLSVYSKAEVDTAISKSGGGYVSQVLWHHSRSIPVDGTVFADGQLLSRSVYPDLWEAVRTNKVPVVSESAWQSTTASRGAYTVGDGSTTFRIPDYNGAQSGSITAPFLRGGIGISSTIRLSRAPNIKGGVNDYVGTVNSSATEAFTTAVGGGIIYEGSQSGGIRRGNTFSFDASKVSPVYGRDSTTEVSPNFVDGVYIIRAAGSVINSGNIDANALASAISDLSSRVTTLESNKSGSARAYGMWQSEGLVGAMNVSSASRSSIGEYVVNFATPMPSASYIINLSLKNNDNAIAIGFVVPYELTTTGFKVRAYTQTGGAADRGFTFVVYHNSTTN